MSIYERYMTSKSPDSDDEDETNDEESQPQGEDDTKIVLDDDQAQKPEARKKSASVEVDDDEETPGEPLKNDKEKSNILTSMQFLGIMSWLMALIMQLQIDGTLAAHFKLFFYLVACFLEVFILKYLTFEADTYIDQLKNISEQYYGAPLKMIQPLE